MSRKNSFLTPPASTASSPTKITCRITELKTAEAAMKMHRLRQTCLPWAASCNQRFWTSLAPPWSLRPRYLGVRWGWGRGLLTLLLHQTERVSASSVSEPGPRLSDHKQHCERTRVKHDVKSSDAAELSHLHLDHSISLEQRRLCLSVKNKRVFAQGDLRVHDLFKTDERQRRMWLWLCDLMLKKSIFHTSRNSTGITHVSLKWLQMKMKTSL